MSTRPIVYECSVLPSATPQPSTASSPPPPPAAATTPKTTSFRVPFCVEPYSVQRSVAASIRAACEIGNGAVCVLESPTGTGKSQALTCGVLSFAVGTNTSSNNNNTTTTADESSIISNNPASTSSSYQFSQQQQQSPPHRRTRSNGDDNSQEVSRVESAYQQQKAKPYSQQQQQQKNETEAKRDRGDDGEDDDDDDDDDDDLMAGSAGNDGAKILLERVNQFIKTSAAAAARNRRRMMELSKQQQGGASANDNLIDSSLMLLSTDEEDDNKRARRAAAASFLSSSSQESSSSSDNDDDDDDDDEGDFVALYEKLVHSARSKVIYTSRTHSQLAQIIDEVQKGPFRFKRDGDNSGECNAGGGGGGGGGGVRYLHIGSRQQLCINDVIKAQAIRTGLGGPSERLNEMCKEATTAYRQGVRDDKKKKSKKKQPPTLAQQRRAAASAIDAASASCADGSGGGPTLRDIEDAEAAASSCATCAFADLDRIRLLVRYTMLAPRSMQELKTIGKHINACPFYATRYAIPFSELLLMPYSYLVDDKMRSQLLSQPQQQSQQGAVHQQHQQGASRYGSSSSASSFLSSSLKKMKKKKKKSQQQQLLFPSSFSDNSTNGMTTFQDENALLRDAIIVVDEAHNLSEAATAASSASIRQTAVDTAIQVIDAYAAQYEGRLVVTTKQRLRELRSVLAAWLRFLVGYDNNSSSHSGGGGGGGGAVTSSSQQQQQQQCSSAGVVLGTHSLTRFAFDTDTAHINYFTLVEFLEKADAVSRIGWYGERKFALEGKVSSLDTSPIRCMRQVQRIAELLARSPEDGTVVAILSEPSRSSFSQRQQPSQYNPPQFEKTLQVLGLSPSQAVESLTTKARATVLAGGTLQPFPLLKMELFPSYPPLASTQQALALCSAAQHQLSSSSSSSSSPSQPTPTQPTPPAIMVECLGHVVNPNRFLLFPLARGPDGTQFRFTRAALTAPTGKQEMFNSVCLTLLNLSKIIPRGVVVFLPSFALEETLITSLEKSGLLPQIEQKKKLFFEKPSSASSSGGSGSGGEELFLRYTKHIETCKQDFPDDLMRGAILVSVMGGKLSEGINFCDDLGRCVVVIGLPYPNLGDPKLQLKLDNLKRQQQQQHAESRPQPQNPASSSTNAVVAVDWSKKYYDALCMRSVNQSIGRCIRHIKDYAVVVLLDERYNDVKISRQLPKWMQPRLMLNKNFGELVRGAKDFFNQF